MILWVSGQADTQVVRSGDRPLDDDFFTAFERLEQVGAALPRVSFHFVFRTWQRYVLMLAICTALSNPSAVKNCQSHLAVSGLTLVASKLLEPDAKM